MSQLPSPPWRTLSNIGLGAKTVSTLTYRDALNAREPNFPPLPGVLLAPRVFWSMQQVPEQ
eukprot:scaffold193934_cov33-Tisochrysis_lutea.AAC.1